MKSESRRGHNLIWIFVTLVRSGKQKVSDFDKTIDRVGEDLFQFRFCNFSPTWLGKGGIGQDHRQNWRGHIRI